VCTLVDLATWKSDNADVSSEASLHGAGDFHLPLSPSHPVCRVAWFCCSQRVTPADNNKNKHNFIAPSPSVLFPRSTRHSALFVSEMCRELQLRAAAIKFIGLTRYLILAHATASPLLPRFLPAHLHGECSHIVKSLYGFRSVSS
jgi:hypothetical protein